MPRAIWALKPACQSGDKDLANSTLASHAASENSVKKKEMRANQRFERTLQEVEADGVLDNTKALSVWYPHNHPAETKRRDD